MISRRHIETTNFKIGDFVHEKDMTSDSVILDTLLILESEIGNPDSEDDEDRISWYTFYSLSDGEIWYDEPLGRGEIIYYEVVPNYRQIKNESSVS